MFSSIDSCFYYFPPVKSQKLSDESIGALDIASLTKGLLRYTYSDDGLGRRLRKKIIVTDWSMGWQSIQLINELLRSGFDVYYAYTDRLTKIEEAVADEFRSVPPPSVMNPLDVYKLAAEAGISRDEVFLLGPLTLTSNLTKNNRYLVFIKDFISLAVLRKKNEPLELCLGSLPTLKGIYSDDIVELQAFLARNKSCAIGTSIQVAMQLEEADLMRIQALYPPGSTKMLSGLLKKMPGLKTLELDQLVDLDDLMEHSLSELAQLEHLFLVALKFSKEQFQAFINNATLLKTLTLMDISIEEEDALVIPPLNRLEKLSIQTRFKSVVTVWKLFNHSPHLQELILWGNTPIGDIKGEFHLPELNMLTLMGFESEAPMQVLQKFAVAAPRLKTLILNDWVLYEPSSERLYFAELEELVIQYDSEYEKYQDYTESIENILTNAPKIKKIELSGMSLSRFSRDVHLEALEILSLKINADAGALSAATIEKFLYHASKLKSLELFGLVNYIGASSIGGTWNNVLSFPELEFCSIGIDLLEVDVIENILRHTPKLKTLKLTCIRILGDFRKDLNLPELETFELVGNDIGPDNVDWIINLTRLFVHAPKLKKLILTGWIDAIFIDEFDFSSIEEITFKSLTLSAVQLERLIAKAPKLKRLNFEACTFDAKFSDAPDFVQLEELNISDTTILSADLEKLTSAPKLKRCKLINITKRERVSLDLTPGSTVMIAAAGPPALPAVADQHPSACSTEQKEEKLSYCDYLYQKNDAGEFIPFPEPRFYRMTIHTTFIADIKSPAIIFSPPDYTSSTLESVYPMDFMGQDEANLWGTYPLLLTQEWQPFPTLNASDRLCSLDAREGDFTIPVEISRCNTTGEYLVRLAPGAISSTQSANLFYSLKSSLPTPLTAELPVWITGLIDLFKEFKEDDINFTGVSTGDEMLAAIKEQKTGACRYRALLFIKEFNAYVTKHKETGWVVQMVSNELHALIEIIHKGIHYTVDLGGVHALLEKKETPAPPTARKNTFSLPHPEEESLAILSDMPQDVTVNMLDCISIASISPCYLEVEESKTISSMLILWQSANQKAIEGNVLHFFSEAYQLNEFLKRPLVLPQTLVIDIQHWTARDRVRLHALLDLPESKRPAILLLDTSNMLSADLESRLLRAYKLLPCHETYYTNEAYRMVGDLVDPSPFLMTHASNTNLSEPVTLYGEDNEGIVPIIIDFHNNPSDWLSKLFGKLTISAAAKISWDTSNSALITALATLPAGASARFILRNPPQDARFWTWWQTAVVKREIAYEGIASIALPRTFSIQVQHGYDLNWDVWPIAENIPAMVSGSITELVLNNATFSSYFSIMQQQAGGIHFNSGWLEQYSNQTVKITLTEELSLHQWVELLKAALKHKVTFYIQCKSTVAFPDVLKSAIKRKIADFEPIIISPAYEEPSEEIRGAAIHVPLQALTITDLTGQWHKEETTKELRYEKSELTTYLIEAQGDKKPLVFYGSFASLSSAIKQQLVMALMYRQWFVQGEFHKLQVPIYFIETSAPILKKYSLPSFNCEALPLTTLQADRLREVTRILNDYPWVIIEGPTGVGKTHFFFHTLLPCVTTKSKGALKGFTGIEQLTEWAACPASGPKLLLLDEADIDTPLDWLAGLIDSPPILYWKGKIYPLSDEHRVVLLLNSPTYKGERVHHPFLNSTENKILFEPSSFDDLYDDTVIPLFELLNIPDETRLELRDIYFEVYSKLIDTELTPRELQMMVLLTHQSSEKYCTIDFTSHAMYAALTVAKQALSRIDQPVFDELAEKYGFDSLQATLAYPPTIHATTSSRFAFLPEHDEMRYVFDVMLELHHKRNTSTIGIKGGLGLCSLVIEGPPGVGKTAFVRASLEIKGFKELSIEALLSNSYDPRACYYVSVPTAAILEEKERILQRASDAGHIIVIDEINCGPRLERVMNRVLDSMNTGGMSPRRYGLIIGTQNPIDFAGRNDASKATKHRQWTVRFPTKYSQASLMQLLLYQYPYISFETAGILSSTIAENNLSIRQATSHIAAVVEADIKATLSTLGPAAYPPPPVNVGRKRGRDEDALYYGRLEKGDGSSNEDSFALSTSSGGSSLLPASLPKVKRPRSHYNPALFLPATITEEDDDLAIDPALLGYNPYLT
jgi:hypothetical protein